MKSLLIIALLLLGSRAVSADITEKEARDAADRFIGIRGIDCVVRKLVTEDKLATLLEPYYDIDVHRPGDFTGSIRVRSKDGSVTFMSLSLASSARKRDDTPLRRIDLPEARKVAETFARRKYRESVRGRWVDAPDWDPANDNREYEFVWYQSLGKSGALSPWPLVVAVDAATGRITSFVRPPARKVSVKTEPKVDAAAARRAAAEHVKVAPETAKYTKTSLQVTEYESGKQALTWMIEVRVPSQPFEKSALVFVDAISGEVAGTAWSL